MTTSPTCAVNSIPSEVEEAHAQMQVLRQQNISLQGRVSQLESQKAKMLIESSQTLSTQAQSYLSQMQQQQEAHERITAASTKSLHDLKSQYSSFEQSSQQKIDDLSRKLQEAVKERDFISSQILEKSKLVDQSEIDANMLQRDLEHSSEKVEQINKSLEEATRTGSELAAKLREQIERATTLERDLQSEKQRFTQEIARIEQELESVRNERNTMAVELPKEIEKGKELEIQLRVELERRQALEKREEELSQLRLKAFQLREQSERMNMRNPVCRTTLDKTSVVTNWFNQLLCSHHSAYKNIFLKFQRMEEAIREANLAIYRTKARPEEADFFALESSDVKRNRVREFGLDPYLLILGAESHFGPRNLTSEQFQLINEPIAFAVFASR